ncbi:MAG: GntR family transcriptional regulator [Actinomycetes bacterium]
MRPLQLTAEPAAADTPAAFDLAAGLASFGARTSLREQLVDVLRAAIVAGGMRPGDVYSARTLALRCGASPTPVREAMLDLAKEGLVEVVPNKGYRVTELTDKDLDEITALRELIEVPVVGEVARRGDRDALAALRPLVSELERAGQDNNVLTYVELDHRFHLGLLALAGNLTLVDVVRDLRSRSRLFGLAPIAERGGLLPGAKEHGLILDAVLAGDVREAKRLMRFHLDQVRTDWSGSRRERAT